MIDLIKELQSEHKDILIILSMAKSIGVKKEEGRKKLLDAKDILLKHLAKEDNYLYPVLNKAAETNDELMITLQKYAHDMDEITQFSLDFFEKYSSDIIDDNFAIEFKKLLHTPLTRMGREEKVLYKKYEELSL